MEKQTRHCLGSLPDSFQCVVATDQARLLGDFSLAIVGLS